MIAVNDGIMLRNHISRILKNHFKGKTYYVDLLDLFNEVGFSFEDGGTRQANPFSLLINCRNCQCLGGIPNNIRTNDRSNYHN